MRDDRLATLLDGEASLVTVFGLRGMGSSSLARTALEGRRPRVLDASAWDAEDARARLGALRVLSGAWVLVDQAHHPRGLRTTVARLLSRGARVVVAGTAPLGRPDEHLVRAGPWPDEPMAELLETEARRTGARLTITPQLVEAVDGWPLAARAAIVAARSGVDPAAVPLHAFSPALADALAEAWAGLDAPSRALADVLALAHAPVEARTLATHGAALAALTLRGLVRDDASAEGGVRLLAPVRAWARAALTAAPVRRARAQRGHVARVLGAASEARDAFRADPIAARRRLGRLEADLIELVLEGHPRSAEAALALEPQLSGALGRAEVVTIFERARRAAPKDLELGLALARVLITRGEHETARALLVELGALRRPVYAVALRHVWLAHLSAWSGRLDEAAHELDVAAGMLERPTHEPARHRHKRGEVEEDLLLQRVFVAYRRHDLDATDRLSRALAERAARGPSVRMATLARRFSAEVLLERGQAGRAASLFARCREELLALGDEAGALFLASRAAAALAATGSQGAAALAAADAGRAAARAGAPAHEALLLLLMRDRPPPPQVLDLVWRVQVPEVRAQLHAWLEAHPAREPAVLVLDPRAHHASLAGRSLVLAERLTPWRVLVALAEAHQAGQRLGPDALFRAAWPGQRADATSRKKRVQTAVWTLRRGLLGASLVSEGGDYGLERGVKVVIAR